MSVEPSNMSIDDQIHIPSELAKFLRQETYSLLIKGHAGTGKTTLALSMLRQMQIDKNCLYISTRVSPGQLFQYHPWLAKFFFMPTKSNLMETQNSVPTQPVFLDARLDEPASLFERITNELMDVKAPTIIIDTWDAIGMFMDKEALMNNARVLQTWRERAGAKLVFVSESPEDKIFDFLVDGIAELKLRHYNERCIREIFLSKLRGVRINHPSYIFSVNNGIFRSFDRYNPSDFLRHAYLLTPTKKTEKAKLIKNNSHLATGYEELDRLLGGGFPVEGIVFVELESNVSAKIALAFLAKTIDNFVENSDVLLLQPLENSGIELMEKQLRTHGIKKNLITILRTFQQPKKPSSPKKNSSKSNGQEEYLQKTIITLKKKYPKKQLLSILSSDITDELKSSSGPKQVSSFLSFIKSHSTLSIFVSRRTSESRSSYLSEHSDVYLRILEINGTILLQPEVPWSHLCAITFRHEKDRQIELEPIV